MANGPTSNESGEPVEAAKEETRIWFEPGRAALAAVPADTDMVVNIKVACPSGCDLRGQSVEIIRRDGSIVKKARLVDLDEATNGTGEFTLKSAAEIGEHTWAAVSPQHTHQGTVHEESLLPFTFLARPHETNITVFDTRDAPPIVGEKYAIKIGVGCQAECSRLEGQTAELYDDQDKMVASGVLEDQRLTPGQFYWADIEFEAPAKEGEFVWMAKFPESAAALPHLSSAVYYPFRTGPRPDEPVTIKVRAEDTHEPLPETYITLEERHGLKYKAKTDDEGVASLTVARGDYRASIACDGYEPFQQQYKEADQLLIEVELALFV